MSLESFNWILTGLLAGSAQPGLFEDFAADMAALDKLGIRCIVSLTELPLSPSPEAFGFRFLHFPIDDMSIPRLPATRALCEEVIASIEDDRPVLMHCKAGLGRTGTMIACCLVTMGRRAEEAIAEIRRINYHYIQTAAQEQFVAHYADYLRDGTAAGVPLPRLRLKLPTAAV